jgi:hypothetical protein
MLTTFVLDFSNVSDKSQLQSYPYVLGDLFDLEDLAFQGLSITVQPTDEGEELVTNVADQLQDEESAESFCMRIINKVSSMASKGLLVCFQVIIDGTMKQHDIRTNGSTARRNKKFTAFDNMQLTSNKSPSK